MDLKKKEIGLSILVDDRSLPDPISEKLGRLLIGLAIGIGLWGMGRGILPAQMLPGILLALCVILLPDKNGKWTIPLFGICAASVVIFGLISMDSISSTVGAIGNDIRNILMEKTGYYQFRMETGGITLSGCIMAGIMLGIIVGVVLRCGNPIPVVVLTVCVLSLCIIGMLQVDLFLGLYLMGVLVSLNQYASGNNRTVFAATGLVFLIGTIVLLICGYEGPVQIDTNDLQDRLHESQYECSGNPLPEGEIAYVGRWSPSSSAALEITMEEWKSVYLRGFVGSEYTGSGWEEEDLHVLAESSDLLYSLQKEYFHPYTQLSAAANTLEEQDATAISVTVKNACKAYAYLPYGIGDVTLDPRDLTDPELMNYTGRLYELDQAYLIQKELSDGAGTADYLSGENAYRDFVYANYLELPEKTAALLQEELGTPDPAATTTKIKETVLDWVDQTLIYDEYASTRAGSTDLAVYLTEVSPFGYSVHYATLGALAMRHMGLPARYVEGYVVTRKTAATMAAGETLVLSQENAHAWVEYYLDGVGWIPFDVTPGYEKELIYHLPPDGTGVQNRDQQEEIEPTEPEKPPVKQDPDSGSQTKLHRVKVVYSILLGILLLLLIAFLIRILLLRKKLRERLEKFRQDESKETLLDCLQYQFEILSLMGLRQRNIPMMKQEKDISQILFGDDVTPLLHSAQELCFSDHPITTQQRELILKGLDRVLEVWSKVTPASKKLRTKWLQCKVL